MLARIGLPEGWSLEALSEIQGAELSVEPATKLRLAFLDTFDWRLANAGARLEVESCDGFARLRWISSQQTPEYVLPVDDEVRFVEDLPAGLLRSQLEPLIEVRALLPVGEAESVRRSASLRDGFGNILVHLKVETASFLDRSGAPAGVSKSRALLRGVPGFEPVYDAVLDRVRATDDAETEATDFLVAAAAVRGRRPGDYSSKIDLEVSKRQRADDALRTILRKLFDTLLANVEGVLDDLDIEFLHDFRVAGRRTRCALSQLKAVLPDDGLARFRDDFKWLGSVTGPCRDLDVYLLEMDTCGETLPDAIEQLRPLEDEIMRARRRSHRAVRRALTSSRFQRLVEDWPAFLDRPTPEPAPPQADRRIREVANEQILKAYRRITKRGSKLGANPPAATLHRLRIDAKKLRYLLEFFSSLYPPRKIGARVKELKRLQDILGGFNDMDIQQTRLTEFAGELSASGRATAETLLAIGRLSAAVEGRQEEFRRSFSGRFVDFASAESRRSYHRLFGRG